ncbi:MAG: hypothetical protein NVSMB29_16440 [Candidatus Dormibacteria bacterium]
MSATTLVLILAGTAYVIARQMMGEPVQLRRLFLVPLGLALWGANDLDHSGLTAVSAADVLLLAASAVAAVGLGVARGATVALFSRGGALWYRSTLTTLAVWGVSIAARGLVLVGAHALGGRVTTSTGALLLMLGLTLGAQSVVVYARGTRSGIGFAPDRRRRKRGAAGPASVR